MELILPLTAISLVCTTMVIGACGIACRSDTHNMGDTPASPGDEAAAEENPSNPNR